jgi:putative ABC transport system substrate-binding protein
LVGLQPDIIATNGTPATVAVHRETRTIPIVFMNVADPVASGTVARLDRPSGNVTGFANYEATLGGKWLELLSEIAPGLNRAAIMFNPDTAPLSTIVPSFETAAQSLKIAPIIAPVHSDLEIETAIMALGREPGGGLFVVPDGFIITHRAPVISAAARNNVPAVYTLSEFARDGGLLSYGPDPVDSFRRAATYVDRILRGAMPAELPVQFPTKFEMAVNLKTAKGFCQTPEVLVALTRWVRLRLRAALWRQWKTPRRRRAALIALGVRGAAQHGRHRPWTLASRPEQSPLRGTLQCPLQIARSPVLDRSALA